MTSHICRGIGRCVLCGAVIAATIAVKIAEGPLPILPNSTVSKSVHEMLALPDDEQPASRPIWRPALQTASVSGSPSGLRPFVNPDLSPPLRTPRRSLAALLPAGNDGWFGRTTYTTPTALGWA